MARQGVGFVAPLQTSPGRSSRKSNAAEILGAVGGVAGGAAGAIAGALTPAGPAGAVAGGIGGTAAGMGLGNTIGKIIDPERQGTSAMERRLDGQGLQVRHSEQSDQLRNSLMALQQAPPEIQQEYKAPLAVAYMHSVSADNPRGQA